MMRGKGIILVGTMVLLFTGAFLLGTVYAQHKTEDTVKAAETTETREEKRTKEVAGANEEKAADPAVQLDVSKKMAQYILTEMPDAPLLQKYAKDDYGNSSLENSINDVNATKGAKEAIIRLCKDAKIDVAKAKVRDLTEEQIVQIDQEVYGSPSNPQN